MYKNVRRFGGVFWRCPDGVHSRVWLVHSNDRDALDHVHLKIRFGGSGLRLGGFEPCVGGDDRAAGKRLSHLSRSAFGN